MTRLLVLTTLTFLGSVAQALPLPKVPRALAQLPPTFTENYNFEGIIALDDCSASLVRFENSLDTDKALALTNGHCLETGMPAVGTFVSHQSSSRELDLMNSTGETVASLNASEVVYSTMSSTDITIYKLDQTYAQIEAQYKVQPFTLSSQHPTSGQPIEIISGYWSRGYACSISAFVFKLQEDGYTWNDSIRYTEPGCEVIGGTSGSPVILSGTRTIIAINNTGNENGERCTMDNPCEIDQDGNVTIHEGDNYAEETYQIYSCVNANREIDLTVPGCQLPH